MKALNMNRRTFAKMAALTAGAAALSAALPAAGLAEAAPDAQEAAEEEKVIRTACRGCGKYECGVLVTVKNGRAVKIEGERWLREAEKSEDSDPPHSSKEHPA